MPIPDMKLNRSFGGSVIIIGVSEIRVIRGERRKWHVDSGGSTEILLEAASYLPELYCIIVAGCCDVGCPWAEQNREYAIAAYVFRGKNVAGTFCQIPQLDQTSSGNRR